MQPRLLLELTKMQSVNEVERGHPVRSAFRRENEHWFQRKWRTEMSVFAGQVALIRLDSPCQIHPLIAQSWRTRLPKYIVIAANTGFMPGKVNFAARTSAMGVSVLDFLRGFKLENISSGSYGQGHDQASGGVLPVDAWNELLQKMGFPASVFAKIS